MKFDLPLYCIAQLHTASIEFMGFVGVYQGLTQHYEDGTEILLVSSVGCIVTGKALSKVYDYLYLIDHCGHENNLESKVK